MPISATPVGAHTVATIMTKWPERTESGLSGCLLWTGTLNGPSKIPYLMHKGRRYSARRVVWEAKYGDLPEVPITTWCGTEGCVEPSHLCLQAVSAHMPAAVIRQRQEATNARFWAKVPSQPAEGCWPWDSTMDHYGYGKFWASPRNVYAHRFAYEVTFGPIPAGMQLDHVCHTRDVSCPGGPSCAHRRCVNPAHLEAVTPRENNRRGRGPAADCARRKHCPQGHPYDEVNTIIDCGQRRCRACRREYEKSRPPRKRNWSKAGKE